MKIQKIEMVLFPRSLNDKIGHGLQSGILHIAAFLLLAIFFYIWWVAHYNPDIIPLDNPDSSSYINFSETRPHVYSWFLWVYRHIVGGYMYLNHVQMALLVIAALVLSISVGLRTDTMLVGAALFLFILVFSRKDYINAVMSDTLYEFFVLLSCSALIFYFRSFSLKRLALASLCIGLAIATRTIGYVLVPALGLCLLLSHCKAGTRPRWSGTVLVALLPMTLVCLLAATSNYAHNGTFRIGSWGGMSLFGKGLVLARPLPDDHPLAHLNWVTGAVAPAQDAIGHIGNPVLKALVVRQYYEYLRWRDVVPEFNRRWPAWREASAFNRGKLAGDVASAEIRNNIGGYADLFTLDYLSLWFMPRMLFPAEQRSLSASYRALGDLPFLSDFEKTPLGKQEYFMVVPPPARAVVVVVFRVINISFLICTVGLFLSLAFQAGRDWLRNGNLDLLFIALAVHGSYFATALVEAGIERYTIPTWPMMPAFLTMLIASAIRCARQKAVVRCR